MTCTTSHAFLIEETTPFILIDLRKLGEKA